MAKCHPFFIFPKRNRPICLEIIKLDNLDKINRKSEKCLVIRPIDNSLTIWYNNIVK